MMNFFFKEKKIVQLLLVISVMAFFSFGFYHLTKFETVDEHFWKYERVGKYWEGWKLGLTEGKWRKTHINDKPGITTAIISGIGLLFEPNPESHRIRDDKITEGQLYTVYDEGRTEKINLALRLPLLLFNSFFLLFFFWTIKKITGNSWLSAMTVMFMAFTPVLVGISQIINPDTLLWTFAAGAIFSYFALLKFGTRNFLILTTLLTGLSLLSKYTANVLFPLYIIIFLSNLFIDYSSLIKTVGVKKYILDNLKHFAVIAIGAVTIFSLLMPSVFERSKHLFEGTVGSPVLESIYPFLLIFLALLLADALILKSKIISIISKFLNEYKQVVLSITSMVLIFFFVFVIINPWTSNPIIPLDNVKEDAFYEKDLLFPMLAEYNPFLKLVTKLAIEMQPFIFSLTPLVIFSILFLWCKIIFKKIEKFELPVFIITLFTLIYFAGTLYSGVLANPRYSIILYPLYAFLAAIGIYELVNTSTIRKFLPKKREILISIFIIHAGVFSLWNTKPFYLTYENFLLPKEYVLTDAWGYGSYEAAQHLNSKPNASDLVIWSDRSAICQF
ncbi:glycosyltransferase family 39 protein, partial [Patescibacteria group bacterium]